MAGATPQRTSHAIADVSTVRGVAWYRPIEAFISGATQLITANGRVYVATGKGLVVLDGESGSLVCRFDTELAVATPTVEGNSVYLPGFDRTLYSVNGSTCAQQWAFTGAGAGFSANPVVADGRVYVGNRDGRFYAINASNGSLVWSFTTGGPIMQSAAYDGSRLYFASLDMYGYAIEASSGAQVWRTPAKLPGEKYTLWWPVVHGNYLVWAAATAYRFGLSPGSDDAGPDGVDAYVFFGDQSATVTAGTVVSSSDASHGWTPGSSVMSTTQGAAAHTLQGWANSYPARRVYAIVNRSNGAEPFYLPWLEGGQNPTGQMHPPVSDGTALYFNGASMKAPNNIPRSRPMAWREGVNWLRLLGGTTFAVDEPLILSMANGRLLANLCCDREARSVSPTPVTYWSYGGNLLNDNLPSQGEPNSYDPMWAFYNGQEALQRLQGYYKGNTSSRNGVYHNHGMQNPLVPLAYTNASGQRIERVFTHRSNTIIALGPTATKTPQPLVAVNTNPPNRGRTLSATDLRARLEREVQRMVDLFNSHGENGFLNPAYVNLGNVSNTVVMPENSTYFKLPADTLYSLSMAYPHLSTGLQGQLRSYLAAYWQKYFVTNRVRTIGWTGSPREAMAFPAEVLARMAQINDSSGGSIPPRVFQAAWRYAQVVPSQAASIYGAVRPLLIHPVPDLDSVRSPALFNDYIVGYQGFLNLYDMAGTNPDPSLRTAIASSLASLISTRTSSFAKDHPWRGTVDNPGGIAINNYVRQFNCTRNFLYMTPGLGHAMRTSAQAGLIQTSISEYEYVCANWYMARDHNSFQELSAHHIFDAHAVFLAKAYIRGESQAELSKWIDVPWMRGDLYHIQNLVAALEAGGGS